MLLLVRCQNRKNNASCYLHLRRSQFLSNGQLQLSEYPALTYAHAGQPALLSTSGGVLQESPSLVFETVSLCSVSSQCRPVTGGPGKNIK